MRGDGGPPGHDAFVLRHSAGSCAPPNQTWPRPDLKAPVQARGGSAPGSCDLATESGPTSLTLGTCDRDIALAGEELRPIRGREDDGTGRRALGSRGPSQSRLDKFGAVGRPGPRLAWAGRREADRARAHERAHRSLSLAPQPHVRRPPVFADDSRHVVIPEIEEARQVL